MDWIGFLSSNNNHTDDYCFLLKGLEPKVIPKSDDLKAQQSQKPFYKILFGKQEKKVKTSINGNRNEANCLTGWVIYVELIQLVGELM